MTFLYIIVMVETLVVVVMFAVVYFLYMNLVNRISKIEKNIRHLSAVGQYFPDFNREGEGDVKNIPGELRLKPDVLNQLTSEAERISQRLGKKEEQVKEHKPDKDTINKILILVNQGFTPAEIAPKLDIPIGEIELVIKLRRYLGSPIKERL